MPLVDCGHCGGTGTTRNRCCLEASGTSSGIDFKLPLVRCCSCNGSGKQWIVEKSF